MCRKYALVLFCAVLLSACRNKQVCYYGQGKDYYVAIIPFGRFSDAHMEVAQDASLNLSNDTFRRGACTVFPPMPADSRYYYPPRQRYRADKLLQQLFRDYEQLRDKYEKNRYRYILLVTDEPISTTVHGQKDYGICGLSSYYRNVSVVSAWRLSDAMFAQTIRHEWGHAVLGIAHCTHPRCIMNDAGGKAANLEGHTRFEEACGQKVRAFFNCYYHNKCP